MIGSNGKLSSRRLLHVFSAAIAVFTMLFGSFVPAAAAAPAQQGAPTISIYPIDRSKILAGAYFDLRVEVNGAQASNIAVTINGQDASSVFPNARVERNNPSATSSAATWYKVAFAGTGEQRIAVNATVGGSAITRTVTVNALRTSGAGQKAKNVILFIGDGMSYPTITMARIVSKGLTEGRFNGWLEMDQMQYNGKINTSGLDSLVTDSANSASAYATGQKSVVNAMGVYPDNTDANNLDNPQQENLLELLKRSRGMATGLVSTADVTDATPAAFQAHTRRRSDYALIAESYLDPAHQPDVLLGGGSAYFLPKSTAGSRRTDEKDLVGDFRSQGYAVVSTATELKAAPANTTKMLGLFNTGNMSVYLDKAITKSAAALGKFTDQPTLWDMTDKAIGALSQDPDGFFLMVEGASIDKQLHPMDWQRAAYDTIEFDKAIGVARRYQASHPDTLVLITADHSHSLSITGSYYTTDGKKGAEAVRTYADSKFPTFVDADGDGFPENPNPDVTLAVGYGNHPEYYETFGIYGDPTSPTVPDPNDKNKYIANPARGADGILIPRNIPALEGVEVHTADDVPLMASGPGAAAASGMMDNTELFFVIANALALDPTTPTGRSISASVQGGTIGNIYNPETSGGSISGPVPGMPTTGTDPQLIWWALTLFAATIGFAGGVLANLGRRADRRKAAAKSEGTLDA